MPTRHPAEEELVGYLFPVLSSLCTYGSHLDRMAQVGGVWGVVMHDGFLK